MWHKLSHALHGFLQQVIVDMMFSFLRSYLFIFDAPFLGPVYLIQFKFRQLEIPPGFNVNHLGKCNPMVL